MKHKIVKRFLQVCLCHCFRPQNLHAIILKKDKSWWLIHVFSPSEGKISVLTSTLIEFTLLLILQSYTEDYQQDKGPKL